MAGALVGAPGHVQYFTRSAVEQLLARCDYGVPQWLPSIGLYEKPPARRWKTRLLRAVVRRVHWAGGDANLYLSVQAL
jgi:hypothetical protein